MSIIIKKYLFFQPSIKAGIRWCNIKGFLSFNYLHKYISYVYLNQKKEFLYFYNKISLGEYFKFIKGIYLSYYYNYTKIIIVNTFKDLEFKPFIKWWCLFAGHQCHDACYLGVFSNKRVFSFKRSNLNYIKSSFDLVIFLDADQGFKILRELYFSYKIITFGFIFNVIHPWATLMFDFIIPFSLKSMFSIHWIFTILYYIKYFWNYK